MGGTFSNFFQSEFTDPNLYPGLERLEKWRKKDGTVTFQHVEQYMHAIKAIIFADFDTMDKIMEEGVDPVKAKKLGRQVEGYIEDEWQSRARWVVARGILLKFSQNKEMKIELAQTGKTMLVECAPRDQRWVSGKSFCLKTCDISPSGGASDLGRTTYGQ